MGVNKFWLVWNPEDMDKPVKYDNYEEACAMGKALALRYGSEKVYIFQAIGYYQTQEAVFECLY